MEKLTLHALPNHLAVCQLAGDSVQPDWHSSSSFWAVIRTPDELTVVCDEDKVPTGLRVEPGWRAFKVAGTLDFELVGILSGLLTVLAQAQVSVFTLSTFDTDYVLVKDTMLETAASCLRAEGYTVVGA